MDQETKPTFGKTGWSVKMVDQNDSHVRITIYCKDEDRFWYKLNLKVPKEKMKCMQ